MFGNRVSIEEARKAAEARYSSEQFKSENAKLLQEVLIEAFVTGARFAGAK
jgi:hypothetical protein